MRKLILAAAVAGVAMPMAMAPAPADAQRRGYNERQEARECRRELRQADTRREYNRERRECARELAQARNRDWRTYNRYDYNRPGPSGSYYADDYYRDGRYYRERRLSASDRIYRGRDGRYYCRRDDGTTGLIIGAGVGALIGNSIDDGRSSLLGTILGAAAGGAIGREIDRSSSNRDLRCR
ncbi:MAG TPA: glycine zipper 2TM domain-containing protein [Allosphingosinicella sp.]|nr:glycine zipper 2TM domain-containing protein [Allosphingosinicella sp.]